MPASTNWILERRNRLHIKCKFGIHRKKAKTKSPKEENSGRFSYSSYQSSRRSRSSTSVLILDQFLFINTDRGLQTSNLFFRNQHWMTAFSFRQNIWNNPFPSELVRKSWCGRITLWIFIIMHHFTLMGLQMVFLSVKVSRWKLAN